MNETIHTERAPEVPWPTSGHRALVPDTSMLPGNEKPASATVDLLNHAVQGAHETIDRLAGSAAPVARQLGERVCAARDAVSAKSHQLRDTRDEWVDSARSTVRANPLTCVAAAAAVGAVIARISRWK